MRQVDFEFEKMVALAGSNKVSKRRDRLPRGSNIKQS
jgi:hypothetical protein